MTAFPLHPRSADLMREQTAEQQDTQYEETTIKTLERHGDYWQFTRADGWSFQFAAADAPDFTPKIGDTVRFYGRGVGYVVRGLTIAGRSIYYRTEDEQRAKDDEERAAHKAKRLREFEETGRAKLDAKYAALPPVFQARIDRFRQNNPDFRVEYEGYEMFCCEEAVKLARHLGTVEAAEHYSGLTRCSITDEKDRWYAEWEEQKAIDTAAGISNDHSGNTHGAMVALAFWYLKHPENVERMHGALSPLVGSAAYGDIPREASA